MIAKPIPLNLLIHTITYKGYAGSNGWDGSFDQDLIIKNVRVDASANLKRSGSGGVSSEASHVVFVDRTHSTSYPEFKEQSKIVWNGKEYELYKVKPLYDTSQIPHHYELELK
jgi:Minor capsid protein